MQYLKVNLQQTQIFVLSRALKHSAGFVVGLQEKGLIFHHFVLLNLSDFSFIKQECFYKQETIWTS